MRKRMMEEAEKHLNGSMKSVLILSVVTMCTGLLWTWNGLEAWKAAGWIWTAENSTRFILGVWCLLPGVWGVHFSRKRHRHIPDCEVILWHSLDVLGAGWFLEAVAMGYTAAAFLFHTGWEEDRVLFVMFAILFSCAAFFCFMAIENVIFCCVTVGLNTEAFLGKKQFRYQI